MPQTLRVMAYNILYGGVTDGRDRTAQLAAQVNAVQPDALALCECWGFLDDGGVRMDAFCDSRRDAGRVGGSRHRQPRGAPLPRAVVARIDGHDGVAHAPRAGADGAHHRRQHGAGHRDPPEPLLEPDAAAGGAGRRQPHPALTSTRWSWATSTPFRQAYDAPLQSRRLLDEQLRPDTHVCEYFAGAGFTDVLAAHGVTSHTYPTPLEPKRDDFLVGVRLDYIMASHELASVMHAGVGGGHARGGA